MNTKRAIQHLKDNGFTVRIVYVRERAKAKFLKNITTQTPSELVGKFKPGGLTTCRITKLINKKDKLINTYSKVSIYAKARCMEIDEFIPRIGRAIAFERAVKNFPEAKKCLEDAGLYSEYVENKEKENES